jgi:uncharacterized metal-binding protein YceD (DUF177 family)
MERSKQYVIQFAGLKDGEHEFEFQLGLEFIRSFNNDEVLDAKITAHITLNKKPEMLEMLLRTNGNLSVACDRCDKPLEIEREGQQRQLFKVGEREEYDNEEVVIISANDYEIDVSDHLYECIILALPLRKVHKKKHCDPIALAALEAVSINNESESDPRWEALKAL